MTFASPNGSIVVLDLYLRTGLLGHVTLTDTAVHITQNNRKESKTR